MSLSHTSQSTVGWNVGSAYGVEVLCNFCWKKSLHSERFAHAEIQQNCVVPNYYTMPRMGGLLTGKGWEIKLQRNCIKHFPPTAVLAATGDAQQCQDLASTGRELALLTGRTTGTVCFLIVGFLLPSAYVVVTYEIYRTQWLEPLVGGAAEISCQVKRRTVMERDLWWTD